MFVQARYSSVGHVRGKRDGIVDTRLETSMLCSVKRIFHKSQPTRDDIRKIYEGMILTKLFVTLGLIPPL